MNKITFNQASASGLPSSPGAYILGNGSKVHYVGRTDDLQRRTREHLNNETNPRLRAASITTMWYEPTRTVADAQRLERAWYAKYRPDCNLLAP